MCNINARTKTSIILERLLELSKTNTSDKFNDEERYLFFIIFNREYQKAPYRYINTK